MPRKALIAKVFLALFLLGSLAAGGVLGAIYVYLVPKLPETDVLQDVRFQVPLRVYSAEGRLIAEFGEKRRKPVEYEDIPPLVRQAFLAAEDDRFFQHPGVDYQGLLRAAWSLATTGEKRQGGSTITMQLARNFFLTREKSYMRKLNEILLALKIEREVSKERILELYLNKIYLGQRAYGVGAAAEIYYGKSLAELTPGEAAMIAGLPKAPSANNPIADPERALARRDYVLGRMVDLGYIDEAAYRKALEQSVTASLHDRAGPELDAPYVAEMVRSRLFEQYGEEIYVSGMKVHTTIRGDLQTAARQAVRRGVIDYERRHGYRGPEAALDLDSLEREAVLDALDERGTVGGLEPAVVTAINGEAAELLMASGETVSLSAEALAWAGKYVGPADRGDRGTPLIEVLRRGDVVRLYESAEGWRLAQVPEVEGSLVSLDPANGGVLALVGGFDFYQSKFNRVTQAKRQPGSGFKPFIYSAALENGYTLATQVNDAPVVFDDPGLEAQWRPENYSGRFFGPTRLHRGLVKSRNLVSIRVLKDIGVDAALAHARQFGLPVDELPRNLSLALGSGDVRQLDLAGAYAVFANGGYRIRPHVIERIESLDGEVLFESDAPVVCEECDEEAGAESEKAAGADPGAAKPRALPESESELPPRAERAVNRQNIFLMRVMLKDVVRRGTGRKAYQALKRDDIAGKTGTTNDQRDAWFTGFNDRIVTSARVGFDDYSPLGRYETGGRAALPIWIDFMEVALDGMPESKEQVPEGIVTARIDPDTGKLADPNDPDAIFEYFRADHVPEAYAEYDAQGEGSGQEGEGGYRSLF